MSAEDGELTGKEFGRYRLLGLIGEGGMGQVYRAHDTVIGRDVAIKVLPVALGEQPGYRERFRREAHTAARLTEPHIIPIHDAGETDDGHLYLVMPIIEGTDVGSLLERDGRLSPQRAVVVIEQLAAALDAAHKQGLVHRDIKPSNALLTGGDFVYLIDFGIAHDAAATRLTSTGMTVGTLAYMAPERFTDGTADARADIYALACVLHECLTGDTPFPGNSVEQQIAGHLRLDPPRPALGNPAIPAGFDDVIATGMAKKSEQRYQSARDLAVAARHSLDTAAAPETVAAAAPEMPTVPAVGKAPLELAAPPPYRALPIPGPTPQMVPRNNNGKIIAAILVGAAIVIAVAVIIAQQRDTPTATTQTTYPTATDPTTTSAAYTSPAYTTPEYTTPEYTTPVYTPPPPPPPLRYGAIAVAGNGASGWSGTSNSLEVAKISALAQCRSVGQNCKVVTSGSSRCFALAGNTLQYSGGSGSTESEAEQDALNRNGGGTILSLKCT